MIRGPTKGLVRNPAPSLIRPTPTPVHIGAPIPPPADRRIPAISVATHRDPVSVRAKPLAEKAIPFGTLHRPINDHRCRPANLLHLACDPLTFRPSPLSLGSQTLRFLPERLKSRLHLSVLAQLEFTLHGLQLALEFETSPLHFRRLPVVGVSRLLHSELRFIGLSQCFELGRTGTGCGLFKAARQNERRENSQNWDESKKFDDHSNSPLTPAGPPLFRTVASPCMASRYLPNPTFPL